MALPLAECFSAHFTEIVSKQIIGMHRPCIPVFFILFEITNVGEFSINTVSESVRLYRDTSKDIIQERGIYYPVNTEDEYSFEKGDYSMLFEICMGKPLESIEKEEVYYKFTFNKEESPTFKVLKDDPYGWSKQMSL